MYEYEIEEICVLSENKYSVEISLDTNGLYTLIVIFDFPSDFFDDCITGYATSTLKEMLTDNYNLYLIRITRIALGSEEVKQDLRTGKNGIFEINYLKWKKIVNKVEQEEKQFIRIKKKEVLDLKPLETSIKEKGIINFLIDFLSVSPYRGLSKMYASVLIALWRVVQ